MLIADDDPWLVRVLAERCARMGFDVQTATNGMQALLKARRCKPDVLVIDVNMPEVDGLSVCAQLLEPDHAPLHVVVATGSRDPETCERCDGLGAIYARKGANFWNVVERALAEFYPAMKDSIGQGGIRPAAAVPVRSSPRVLLVDDDTEVKMLLASRLKRCGVEVLNAANAIEGFKIACREEPTVIVTDYFMPNGDAQYLLTKLRGSPLTANIPVIVITGRDLSDVVQFDLRRDHGDHRGAAQVMRKSIDTAELFGVLQEYCGFETDPRL